jgi:mono/diheme cytochrome c family protein
MKTVAVRRLPYSAHSAAAAVRIAAPVIRLAAAVCCLSIAVFRLPAAASAEPRHEASHSPPFEHSSADDPRSFDRSPAVEHFSTVGHSPSFEDAAAATLDEGKDTFRYDDFGDEDFWGGQLRLHEAIAGAAHGGIGPGVSPATALALGLKVDVRALPQKLIQRLKTGKVDLDDPATTLALLSLDAVVGVKGVFDEGGTLTSVGITCALCHSTVDDSFAPGIGRRLDGWANRDLDVGAIIDAAPSVAPFAQALGIDEQTVRQVLKSWGPGRFDAQLILDGQAFRPDGNTAATLIPPAFGLAGVNLHTSTGWGSVPYWNAFVAVLEMHGKGNFFDPRLEDSSKFPVAAANGFGNVRNEPDLVTPKLAALQQYQLALKAPEPPRGSFDARAAKRGEALFAAGGKAHCASCHVPPLFTEPGWNMHKAEEIGIDDFQARRSPDERYRTTPLKGLWSHRQGGFYHDGRFATLDDVVAHYDSFLGLGLSKQERHDLVEYLKSL